MILKIVLTSLYFAGMKY